MDPTHLHQIAVEAMRSRGLLPAFAPQALQEAEAARHTAPERNRTILDLRHLTWFSIDNDDTRDLDQLSVAEPLAAGVTRLLVAVADVDAKVAPGGAVDGHAAVNTTSVYTAAGIFPMLPEVLSTDLTSLHEGQERLAVVVDMQVHFRHPQMIRLCDVRKPSYIASKSPAAIMRSYSCIFFTRPLMVWKLVSMPPSQRSLM